MTMVKCVDEGSFVSKKFMPMGLNSIVKELVMPLDVMANSRTENDIQQQELDQMYHEGLCITHLIVY